VTHSRDEQPLLPAHDAGERQAFLAAVAEAHHRWTEEHLDEDLFDSDRSTPGSDYNLHTLDVEAGPEAEAAFARAIEEQGWTLDPSGGLGRVQQTDDDLRRGARNQSAPSSEPAPSLYDGD